MAQQPDTEPRLASTDGPRINVIGTSGSGKTAFARRIAARLGLPHVELDELFWGPNWTERPTEVFTQRVREAIAQDAWVMDGNYSRVRPMILGRATAIVWLDFPRRLVTSRVIRRTVRRVWDREPLWAGNVESFRLSFLSKDSIIWWSIKTYGRRKRQYGELFRDLEGGGIELVRPRSPRQAEAWLAERSPRKQPALA